MVLAMSYNKPPCAKTLPAYGTEPALIQVALSLLLHIAQPLDPRGEGLTVRGSNPTFVWGKNHERARCAHDNENETSTVENTFGFVVDLFLVFFFVKGGATSGRGESRRTPLASSDGRGNRLSSSSGGGGGTSPEYTRGGGAARTAAAETRNQRRGSAAVPAVGWGAERGGGGGRGGGVRRQKSENSELEDKILEDMLDR